MAQPPCPQQANAGSPLGYCCTTGQASRHASGGALFAPGLLSCYAARGITSVVVKRRSGNAQKQRQRPPVFNSIADCISRECFRRRSICLSLLRDWNRLVDVISCPPGTFHADSQTISNLSCSLAEWTRSTAALERKPAVVSHVWKYWRLPFGTDRPGFLRGTGCRSGRKNLIG
jgi:hypothetical protein